MSLKTMSATAAALLIIVALVRAQDAPATQPSTHPAVIDATDKAAIDAAMGQTVWIEGIISDADWSSSGKVMNIDFQGADESRLLAVLFERRREAFDKSFAGDVSKALTGAKVRLKGKLEPYGGKAESMMGRPQIILNDPHQITILELPSTQPG